MSTSGPSARSASALWVLAVVLGLASVFGGWALSGFDRIPGGRDTLLVGVSLEHTWRFVTGEAGSFWDVPIFWPAPNVAAYTDVMLGGGPLYWPWRGVGLSPDGAMVGFLVVSFVAGFLLFRWTLRSDLGIGSIGATFGAWLFAFGASRTVDVVHPQLAVTLWWLIALIAVIRWLDARRDPEAQRLWLAVFATAMVLQAWTAFYPFFFLGLGVGCAAGVALATRRWRAVVIGQLWRDRWVLAVTLSLAAAALLPLALRYLETAESLGTRPWEIVRSHLQRPAAWFLPAPESLLFGWIHGLDWPEVLVGEGRMRHASGLGPATTVLALAGLWLGRKRSVVRILVATSLVLMALATLWPGGWTLWRPIWEWVPGARGVRAVGRLGQLLLVPASLGVALLVDRVVASGRAAVVPLVALLSWIAAEQARSLPSWSAEAARDRVETLASALDEAAPCRAFFIAGHDRLIPTLDEDAMRVAVRSGVPTLNGRYGNDPPEWGLRRSLWRPRGESLPEVLERWLELRGLDGREICTVALERTGSETYRVHSVGDLGGIRRCEPATSAPPDSGTGDPE